MLGVLNKELKEAGLKEFCENDLIPCIEDENINIWDRPFIPKTFIPPITRKERRMLKRKRK